MEPTPTEGADTLETFAPDMLNNDLRPLLSKWHPRWHESAKTTSGPSQTWSEHSEFRVELPALQKRIEGTTRGLARLAGVRDFDRFVKSPQSAAKSK